MPIDISNMYKSKKEEKIEEKKPSKVSKVGSFFKTLASPPMGQVIKPTAEKAVAETKEFMKQPHPLLHTISPMIPAQQILDTEPDPETGVYQAKQLEDYMGQEFGKGLLGEKLTKTLKLDQIEPQTTPERVLGGVSKITGVVAPYVALGGMEKGVYKIATGKLGTKMIAKSIARGLSIFPTALMIESVQNVEDLIKKGDIKTPLTEAGVTSMLCGGIPLVIEAGVKGTGVVTKKTIKPVLNALGKLSDKAMEKIYPYIKPATYKVLKAQEKLHGDASIHGWGTLKERAIIKDLVKVGTLAKEKVGKFAEEYGKELRNVVKMKHKFTSLEDIRSKVLKGKNVIAGINDTTTLANTIRNLRLEGVSDDAIKLIEGKVSGKSTTSLFVSYDKAKDLDVIKRVLTDIGNQTVQVSDDVSTNLLELTDGKFQILDAISKIPKGAMEVGDDITKGIKDYFEFITKGGEKLAVAYQHGKKLPTRDMGAMAKAKAYMITSVVRHIRDMGQTGKIMATKIERSLYNQAQTAGKWMTEADEFMKLSDVDEKAVVHALETGTKMASPKLQKIASTLKNIFDGVRNIGQTHNVKVADLKGKAGKINWVKDYFPRSINVKAIKEAIKTPAGKKQFLKTFAKLNKISMRQAQNWYDDITKSIYKAPKGVKAQHLLERTHKLPEKFYESNKTVLKNYLEEMSHVTSWYSEWGKDLSVFDGLMNTLNKEGYYTDIIKEAVRLEQGFLTASERATTSFLKPAKTYEVVSKLGLCQLLQINQGMLIAVKTSLNATAKGVINAFTKEGMKKGVTSGATSHSFIKSLFDANKGIAQVFLEKTGTIKLDSFMRRICANTAQPWIDDLVKMAKTGKNTKEVVRELNRWNNHFGSKVTLKTLRKGGFKATDQLVKDVGLFLSNTTQFRNSTFDASLFCGTPAGKGIMMLKSFAYQYSKFMKDYIVTEAINNNWKPFAKLVVGAQIFGSTVGVIRERLKGKTAEEKGDWIESLLKKGGAPEELADKLGFALDNVLQMGGATLMGDYLMSAMTNKEFLAKAVIGVIGSDAVEIGYGIAQLPYGLATGDIKHVKPLFRKATKDIKNLPFGYLAERALFGKKEKATKLEKTKREYKKKKKLKKERREGGWGTNIYEKTRQVGKKVYKKSIKPLFKKKKKLTPWEGQKPKKGQPDTISGILG